MNGKTKQTCFRLVLPLCRNLPCKAVVVLLVNNCEDTSPEPLKKKNNNNNNKKKTFAPNRPDNELRGDFLTDSGLKIIGSCMFILFNKFGRSGLCLIMY